VVVGDQQVSRFRSWLGLGGGVVVVIAIGGWLFLSRQAGPPPPPEPQEAERRVIQTPVQEFQVTLTIPEDKSGRPAAAGTARVSGLIEEAPLGRKTISLAEVDTSVSRAILPEKEEPRLGLTTATTPPPLAEAVIDEAVLPIEQLKQPIRVKGILIPAPQAIPPFAQDEKPVFILETERKGRVITVRGTTNLAVQGNGVLVSLFRIFREAGAEADKRAELAQRHLSLWYEGRFPVEDEPWFEAWAARVQAQPDVYPTIASLDKERVFIDVLFTAERAEVEDVPGLSVYPIPGTNLQVYRIIRPINLAMDPAAEIILARAEGRPAASPEPAKPKKPKKPGPTKIIILPLRQLDGPRPAQQARSARRSSIETENLTPTQGTPPVVSPEDDQTPMEPLPVYE